YVTPDDVVAAIPLIAAVHDQPFGNSSAVPAYYCAKLAREDGVDTILGGDGGDELFGGNERYAKQHLYSLYSDLPRSMRMLIGPRLRYFFKEALRGFLPDAIINKSKHGFGLPFGPWMSTHAGLRAIAMDSLSDLKKRRIVIPAFIDELTSEHVRAHAGYYGS